MNPMGALLVGIYYAGKTTTAVNIGQSVGFEVFDLDEEYTRRHQETIWDTRDKGDRGIALARKQRDAIGNEILQRMIARPSVAVLGGGSFIRENHDVLDKAKKTHLVIYLNPTIDALTCRALDHPEADVRHIFAHRDPITIRRKFERYYQERSPEYLQWCDAFVQPEKSWSVEQVSSAVLNLFIRKMSDRVETDDQRVAWEYDIFLSYSETDRQEAEKIFRIVTEAKGKVFMAPKVIAPGDDFTEKIRAAIQASRELWLLVSPNSVTSQWVISEWGAAWVLHKRIIPILHRCALDALPDHLKMLQCIDLHEVDEFVSKEFLARMSANNG